MILPLLVLLLLLLVLAEGRLLLLLLLLLPLSLLSRTATHERLQLTETTPITLLVQSLYMLT